MDDQAPAPDVDPPDATAVIETMAVGYVTVDRSWLITQVNVAAEEILGRSATQLLGRNLWKQFPGARELEFGRVYEQVMSTGVPAAFDAWYPGLGMWFEQRIQPTASGIACYFLDATARKTADQRAAERAERVRLINDISEALASDLDVESNVTRLAQLVVPYLGSWSIVSLADENGALRDTGYHHVDPSRLADVGRYVEIRQSVMAGTIAGEAVAARRPAVLMTNAHEAIRARLSGTARDRFDVLAPVAGAVLPMIARGRTVGMLSLYSDVEWTQAKYDVAKDIAARAALAIDNSLAYERARLARADAETARAAAERANQRLALLARVSEVLAVEVDPDVAVGALARLVVPQLADFSLVTVVDDEHGLRDIGAAHRDRSREDEVAAYAARRSAMMTEVSPLATALRSGDPVVITRLSDAELVAAQADPDAANIARRLDPHGLAVIPLKARGRVFGALTLVTTGARGPHTDGEITMAVEVARRAGPVLDAARAAHRSRRLAEYMQRSLLALPAVGPGLQIRSRYRPAQLDHEVGGDWYDHYDLSDGTTVVTIGDVMGHDTAAMAAMAQLRTLMRAIAWAGRRSPAAVLTDTHSASSKLGPGTFATAVTGELEPAAADGSVLFRWSCAGHPPPVLLTRAGEVEFLDAEYIDVPLGVESPVQRHDQSVVLAPGSVVLFYSDGLVERRDRDIGEGFDQLAALLGSLRHHDLDSMLDRILAELSPPGPHHDDIALLAVRTADPADDGDLLADRLVRRLPYDVTAPQVARAVLAAYTAAMPPTTSADAAVLVSELVTNALRHGAQPITLDIEQIHGGIRVAVSDHGATYPVLPSAHPLSGRTSGRGLLIIDALSTAWGIDPAPIGKTIWFTVVADGPDA